MSEEKSERLSFYKYLFTEGSGDDLAVFGLLFGMVALILFKLPDIAEVSAGAVIGAAAMYLSGGKKTG